ncbi:MAG: site-2 protease family protein [Myxococcales bacterium FL481]|nr:MAG: site-2 protease family protein [Myxococcales bacterium FL481]
MDWLIAILALSALVIIHEFGHYICARASGMHVHRFSVLGIGPVVLRLFTYKGTDFVISAIPFGGYVQIAGMEAEDPEAPAEPVAEGDGESPLFRDKPLWARLLAIFGGPLANYITAILIAVSVYAVAGINYPTGIKVEGFGAASPAQAAGIQQGDVLVSVDGESVQGFPQSTKLNDLTAPRRGRTVDIVVDRAGELLTLPVALADAPRALGVDLSFQSEYTAVPFGEALASGIAFPFKKTAEQGAALWAMITGERAGRVGGPVAIARAIKGSADRGVLDFLMFSAFISTLLGMFNLLPLPALDGGRLVFLFYELIARRPANQRAEEWVHAIGMIGLLGILVYATVGDVRGPKTVPWDETVQNYRSEMAKARRELDLTDGEAPTGGTPPAATPHPAPAEVP